VSALIHAAKFLNKKIFLKLLCLYIILFLLFHYFLYYFNINYNFCCNLQDYKSSSFILIILLDRRGKRDKEKDKNRKRYRGMAQRSYFTRNLNSSAIIRAIKNENSLVLKNLYSYPSFDANFLGSKLYLKTKFNTYNVPWKITPSIIRAQDKLCSFYDWLNLNSYLNSNYAAIKDFIDRNCLKLLIRPNSDISNILGVQDSGVSINKFNLSNFNLDNASRSNFIDCALLNSSTNMNLNRSSLVYSFINKISKRQYIGSTINPETRLHTYLFSWKKGRQRFLEEVRSTGGLNSYFFHIGEKVPNYLNLFELENSEIILDSRAIFILNCFSEFHVRLIEQAMISYFKPQINDVNVPVSFTFSNININTYSPSVWDKSHPIIAYTESEKVFNQYSSINRASIALGVTKSIITYNRNIKDRYIYCSIPKLRLRFVDEVINEINKSSPLSSHQKLTEVTGIDLNSIPKNEIQARLADSKDIILDTFSSASEFARNYGLNPWHYRYINLDRPICIDLDSLRSNSFKLENPALGEESTKLFVYLCCNPDYRQNVLENKNKKSWPVVSIDTLNNNEVRFHDNPNKARLELSNLMGITDLKASRNFTKDYITGSSSKGGKPSKFLRRFKLMWLHDYKDVEIGS
jgi:hypothetical protein